MATLAGVVEMQEKAGDLRTVLGLGGVLEFTGNLAELEALVVKESYIFRAPSLLLEQGSVLFEVVRKRD